MSHFLVLVAALSREDLSAKLQPFHEYECTWIRDQYVRFVEVLPEDLKNLETDFEAYKDYYNSFEEFVGICHDYEQYEGKWGRWTNPDKKWCQWVVDDSNALLLKDGRKVDYATAQEIDWGQMRRERYETALEQSASWIKSKELPKDQLMQFLLKNGLFNANQKALDSMTAEEYAEHESNQPLFFAWIDQDGKWNEKGKRKWPEMTVSISENASQKFSQFIDSLNSDQMIFVVDCQS